MKTNILKFMVGSCALVMLTGLGGRTAADDTPLPSAHTSYRVQVGTLKSVDEKERTIAVGTFWSTRIYSAGDRCTVQLEDQPNAALKDLRVGYRVAVQYQENGGVRVARQIAQQNLVLTGHITALDPARRTFVVENGWSRKAFLAAEDCQILIRDEQDRALADLKLGHKVTVRYANTKEANMARQVEQASLTFSGTVEAIDTTTGTLKARQAFGSRKFLLARPCPIIIDGRADGQFRDLRIGDQVLFHYEDLDGVLVANRLAREHVAEKSDPEHLSRSE